MRLIDADATRRTMKQPKYKLGTQIIMPAQITEITITSQNELEYGVELFDDVFDESEIDEYNSKLNNPDDSLLTEDSEGCKEQKSKLESDLISRQAAIEVLSHVKDDEKWRSECVDNEIRLIQLLPPVEPKPVCEEHGRLIDADKLLQELFIVDEEEWTTPEIRTILENAPPVEPKRPKGEWVSCSEIPKDRRNVFLAHGTNDFKSCCIGHYEQGMGWYEDRNFFAKPIYDCKYWCDIPELPDLGNKQFGTEVSADMRGDKE